MRVRHNVLLTPYQLGDLALRNRIVMAPLTRTRADNPGDIPNDLMVEYYAQRASAGLIITEGAWVPPHNPCSKRCGPWFWENVSQGT